MIKKDILGQYLDALKKTYNTKTKIGAIIAFAKDWQQCMVEEAKEQGITKERLYYEMSQELKEFERGRLADPNAAAMYNKFITLLKDWDGKD